MAYSNEIVRKARRQLANAKADRESLYQQHLQTAYAQVPRLQQIDFQLRKSMALAAQAVFTQGGDARQAMEQVKQANLALQQEREMLIREHFAPGYLDDTPLCPHCGGSGYIGSTMCRCLQDLCAQEQVKELSLLAADDQRFENFSLKYYSDRMDSTYGASPRAIMRLNFDICRRYAESFSTASGNLLFIGNTGLGKTFLSACIARSAAEKGYSVAYESASHLMTKLEKNRFNPDDQSRYESASHLMTKLEKNRFNPDDQSREDVAKLNSCDLLIVDDLGTELPSNFVTAALYTLINDRLLSCKPMIVSTNLNVDEIARRYSPQIASRLQGNFQRLTFVGEDIRVLKSRGV